MSQAFWDKLGFFVGFFFFSFLFVILNKTQKSLTMDGLNVAAAGICRLIFQPFTSHLMPFASNFRPSYHLDSMLRRDSLCI